MALYLPYPASISNSSLRRSTAHLSASLIPHPSPPSSSATPFLRPLRCRRRPGLVFRAQGKEDTDLRVVSGAEEEKQQKQEEEAAAAAAEEDATPEDLECVGEIQRVVELLKKNRDMTFGEVKLTVLIEDPRDIERKRLLGVDPDDITREDLVAALEDVNEGRIPENRMALQLLAKELAEWPDLEVEAQKTSRPRKSLYAKATDTGVDPEVAAKRLNIDWDSAANIEAEDGDDDDEIDVPPAVGYGALYLVTGLPILIVISVVLILFYNSLQ